MAQEKQSVFSVLNALDVGKHTKEVNGFTYLSWAWAWQVVRTYYPNANYEIRHWDGVPYFFDPALGYMVETSVTIEGETLHMWLPVLDTANRTMRDKPYSFKVKNPNFKYAKLASDGKYRDKYNNIQEEYIERQVSAASMFDINTTIMRCLVKNLAMFGLGLYIYAGEDLPSPIEPSKPSAPEQTLSEVDQAIAECQAAQNKDELMAVFTKYETLKSDSRFMEAMSARKKEVIK